MEIRKVTQLLVVIGSCLMSGQAASAPRSGVVYITGTLAPPPPPIPQNSPEWRTYCDVAIVALNADVERSHTLAWRHHRSPDQVYLVDAAGQFRSTHPSAVWANDPSWSNPVAGEFAAKFYGSRLRGPIETCPRFAPQARSMGLRVGPSLAATLSALARQWRSASSRRLILEQVSAPVINAQGDQALVYFGTLSYPSGLVSGVWRFRKGSDGRWRYFDSGPVESF